MWARLPLAPVMEIVSSSARARDDLVKPNHFFSLLSSERTNRRKFPVASPKSIPYTTAAALRLLLPTSSSPPPPLPPPHPPLVLFSPPRPDPTRAPNDWAVVLLGAFLSSACPRPAIRRCHLRRRRCRCSGGCSTGGCRLGSSRSPATFWVRVCSPIKPPSSPLFHFRTLFLTRDYAIGPYW